jgi:hypothetical protein
MTKIDFPCFNSKVTDHFMKYIVSVEVMIQTLLSFTLDEVSVQYSSVLKMEI